MCGVLAEFLVLASCTDNFKSWNTNPYEVTDSEMEMDNLSTGSYFVQMEKNVFVIEQMPQIGASTYQISQNLAGDIYSGYMGACGTWFQGSNNTTYDLSIDWKNAAFERGFVGIMPAWKTICEKADMMKQPQVAALATIVKVEAMHRLADMYGPLPYSKFGSGELQNPYDSQQAIYDSFFKELTDAVEVLTSFYNKDHTATILSNYDFIYNGNVENWIKFANTLKLRLAIRIAYVDPVKAQQMAEEAVNHSIGVIVKTSEVARLQHTSDLIYRHPLYVIGQGEFNDCRMGATMDSYLNGYSDPRINSYFKLSTAGKFTGIRTGINIVRAQYAEKAPFSDLNILASSDLVWINPSESYFLRAEGALRGWKMNGSAKDLYETGVRTSFAYTGAANVENYLQDNTSTPAPYIDPANSGNNVPAGNPHLGKITIKWNDGAGFEENLERIITQKWIAIFPDGQEAWSEYRRTGYPKVFPVLVNNSGGKINTEKQIRRIPFPNTEYMNNRVNVTQAARLLGGDDTGGTTLWWDKKK